MKITELFVEKFTSICLIILIALVLAAKGGNSASIRGLVCIFVPLLFLLYSFNSSSLKNVENDIQWLVLWISVSAWILFQTIMGYYFVEPTIINLPFSTYFFLNSSGFWAIFSSYLMIAIIVSKVNFNIAFFIMVSIGSIGAFQSLYGLISYGIGQNTILGIWPKEHYINDITGTLINKNHFAGIIELITPIGCSVLWFALKDVRKNRFAVRIVSILSFVSIFWLSVLGSHSRLGFVSFIVGMFAWALLIFNHEHGFQKKKILNISLSLACIFMFILLLFAIWFGVNPLVDRFGQINSEQHRFLTWISILEIPLHQWIVGTGAGSFIDVFRTVQPNQFEPVFDYAHNDYLEFILNFGLLGSILVLASTIFLIKSNWPKQLNTLQIGAFSGMAAILVHSFGDFNLHIPGVALVFWVSVGVLFNQNLKAQASTRRKK